MSTFFHAFAVQNGPGPWALNEHKRFSFGWKLPQKKSFNSRITIIRANEKENKKTMTATNVTSTPRTEILIQIWTAECRLGRFTKLISLYWWLWCFVYFRYIITMAIGNENERTTPPTNNHHITFRYIVLIQIGCGCMEHVSVCASGGAGAGGTYEIANCSNNADFICAFINE